MLHYEFEEDLQPDILVFSPDSSTPPASQTALLLPSYHATARSSPPPDSSTSYCFTVESNDSIDNISRATGGTASSEADESKQIYPSFSSFEITPKITRTALSSAPPSAPRSSSTDEVTSSHSKKSRGRTSIEMGMIKKRRRNRKTLSCEPCRKNKLRCSRDPRCHNCLRRNEKCIWAPHAYQSIPRRQSSKPFSNLIDVEVKSLRRQARALGQRLAIDKDVLNSLVDQCSAPVPVTPCELLDLPSFASEPPSFSPSSNRSNTFQLFTAPMSPFPIHPVLTEQILQDLECNKGFRSYPAVDWHARRGSDSSVFTLATTDSDASATTCTSTNSFFSVDDCTVDQCVSNLGFPLFDEEVAVPLLIDDSFQLDFNLNLDYHYSSEEEQPVTTEDRLMTTTEEYHEQLRLYQSNVLAEQYNTQLGEGNHLVLPQQEMTFALPPLSPSSLMDDKGSPDTSASNEIDLRFPSFQKHDLSRFDEVFNEVTGESKTQDTIQFFLEEFKSGNLVVPL